MLNEETFSKTGNYFKKREKKGNLKTL